MIKKNIINIITFIPFVFGILLCKSDTRGFYGNHSAYIGIPICITSELGIIICRYYSLVRQLECDHIKTLSSRLLLINTIISNAIICFFGVLFFKSLSSDRLGTTVICCCMILGYNIPLAVKRKDRIVSIICLSAIMFILCYIICLKLDVRIFYSSMHK